MPLACRREVEALVLSAVEALVLSAVEACPELVEGSKGRRGVEGPTSTEASVTTTEGSVISTEGSVTTTEASVCLVLN